VPVVPLSPGGIAPVLGPSLTKGILQAVAILSVVAVGMLLLLYCIGSWIGSLIKTIKEGIATRKHEAT